jgi:ATP-dependent DNA ligase
LFSKSVHDQCAEPGQSLEQFAPARAKKKIDDPATTPDGLAWENKIDGMRMKIHTGKGNRHRCDSRCISKATGNFTENTDSVPHIMETTNLDPNSIIDCEFVSPVDEIRVEVPGVFYDKLADADHLHTLYFKQKYQGTIPVYPHVSMTTSVLGSNPELAIQKQNSAGAWIKAYAFDLVKEKGSFITGLSQLSRRKALADLLYYVNPERILLMPQWRNLTLAEREQLFYLLTDAKGEGLIGKNLGKKYDDANNWYKLKRFWPVDCVITGEYKVGKEGKTGVMLDKVSSIGVGVYDKGILHHIGWMSAIMDDLSALMTPAQFLASGMPGRAVECLHNGLQVKPEMSIGHSLRHPRFRRWRDDKTPTDCTFAALQAEIKKGMS